MFVVFIPSSLTLEIIRGTTTIMADLMSHIVPLRSAQLIYPRLLLINTIPPECVDQSEQKGNGLLLCTFPLAIICVQIIMIVGQRNTTTKDEFTHYQVDPMKIEVRFWNPQNKDGVPGRPKNIL